MEIQYFKSEKSGAGYLSEIELLESFLLEKDGALGRLTFASAALEILYDLLAEDEPHPELYDITLQFLRLTDTGPKGGLISLFLAYFLRTLSYLGYRPIFRDVSAVKKIENYLPSLEMAERMAARKNSISSLRNGAGWYVRLAKRWESIILGFNLNGWRGYIGCRHRHWLNRADCEWNLAKLKRLLRY